MKMLLIILKQDEALVDEVEDLVDPEIKMEAAEGEGDQGLHADDGIEL